MVVGPDGFDLRTRDRVPPGTQSLANGARVVLWMMKEIDENVDDTSEIQFLGSRWRGEILSLPPEAFGVELRDAFEGVIAARVAVAGEITDGPQRVKDRSARLPL